jgi:hypothetical protein
MVIGIVAALLYHLVWAKASKLPLEIIIPYFLIFVHPFPRLKRENLPAVGAVSGKFTKK